MSTTNEMVLTRVLNFVELWLRSARQHLHGEVDLQYLGGVDLLVVEQL